MSLTSLLKNLFKGFRNKDYRDEIVTFLNRCNI